MVLTKDLFNAFLLKKPKFIYVEIIFITLAKAASNPSLLFMSRVMNCALATFIKRGQESLEKMRGF